MAYTTPRTWVAGEVLTATNMNTHVRDNISYLEALTLDAIHEPTASVDFNTQQIVDFCVENLASEPSLAMGRMYYNTASKKLFICKAD